MEKIQEIELSKCLAEISGVMITIIVMLRTAFYKEFPSNYSNFLGFAMIFISITLVLGLVNFKIKEDGQRRIVNTIAMILLIIGLAILISIISIPPS